MSPTKVKVPIKVTKGYRYDIQEKDGELSDRILIGSPMTGSLRAEWVLGRYGQVIPCNWAVNEQIQWINSYSPIRFQVADARNLIVANLLEMKKEWLFFIDHDVILPPTTFITINDYMIRKEYPIVSGLYFTKSVPSEPLIYRGMGTGYYSKWKMGDKVWVSGHGMGCTLIHSSILKEMWDISEPYQLGNKMVRRVFRNPAEVTFDPEKREVSISVGTEDLAFLEKVIKRGVLKKAGWKKFDGLRYPFIVDTSLFCRHIDDSGVQYPARGEHLQYVKKK